jgi:beta-glucanase (GH16 family)
MRRQSASGRYRLLKAVVPGLLLSSFVASCAAGTQPSASPLNPDFASEKASPNSTSGDGTKWVLSWEDDFKGTGLPTKWTFDVGGYGFGDNQLEWNSDDNAKLSGQGGLVITAGKGGAGHECWYGPCDYTGAKIQTTFAQTYGRFEARIKLPAGRGLWPAFWMVPAAIEQNPKTLGEIDVIEVNNVSPYLIEGFAHDGSRLNSRARDVTQLPASSQFHTYGVDWTPSGITWTLDGQSYGHMKAYPNWPFDQPFIMILDLEVGGTWPGSPNADTVFPAQMLVSWVRVYKLIG